ncbi:MAG: hypothetical protein O3C57_04540 [Verrucomicrobia bacterium]|nr:hypothetical protein [Verrucomicrobiota bacterium]
MADIHFTCAICGETLTATPPTRRGDNIDCPACNNRITIPRAFNLKPILMLLVFVALMGIAVSRYLPSGKENPEHVVPDTTASSLAPEPVTGIAQATPDHPHKLEKENSVDPVDSVSAGMSTDDVLRIMGRSDYTYGKGDTEYWKYGPWEIAFVHGKLSEKIRRGQR